MKGNQDNKSDWGTFLLAVLIVLLICILTWPPVWMF